MELFALQVMNKNSHIVAEVEVETARRAFWLQLEVDGARWKTLFQVPIWGVSYTVFCCSTYAQGLHLFQRPLVVWDGEGTSDIIGVERLQGRHYKKRWKLWDCWEWKNRYERKEVAISSSAGRSLLFLARQFGQDVDVSYYYGSLPDADRSLERTPHWHTLRGSWRIQKRGLKLGNLLLEKVVDVYSVAHKVWIMSDQVCALQKIGAVRRTQQFNWWKGAGSSSQSSSARGQKYRRRMHPLQFMDAGQADRVECKNGWRNIGMQRH